MKTATAITKSELLQLGFGYDKTIHGKCLVYYGRDMTDEYILVWFDEEDSEYPREIDVVALNNNVELHDEEVLDWEHLSVAIWMCFWENFSSDPMQELLRKMPYEITFTSTKRQ